MLQVKLSTFYFFYFALLGVTAPYLSLFLDSEGFSAAEIGQLTGLLMATKVLAPNIWGAIADKTQKRLVLVRFGALATLLSYVGFFMAEGFWQYASMIILFSFFWNAVLPQFEVITLHSLKGETNRYSLIRLWGSIGFVVAVISLGWLLQESGISAFAPSLFVVIFAIFLASLFHFDEPSKCILKEGEPSVRLLDELKLGGAYLFFGVSFLLQLSHGAYYSYYSLHLEALGYEKLQIGALWALGVIAEIVLFSVMHFWHRRHSVKLIMAIALFFSGGRWLLIAYFSDVIWMLVVAQILHAFSFGAMHAASIYYVHHHFSIANQGRAQAMYSSLGFGLGGSLGALLMASLVNQLGYEGLFAASAGIVFLAFALLKPMQQPKGI
jgi:PPP family 3-phenylpropionic acid transporter